METQWKIMGFHDFPRLLGVDLIPPPEDSWSCPYNICLTEREIPNALKLQVSYAYAPCPCVDCADACGIGGQDIPPYIAIRTTEAP